MNKIFKLLTYYLSLGRFSNCCLVDGRFIQSNWAMFGALAQII